MTTYLIIGIAGLVLLAVSVVAGDLFGGVHGALEAVGGDVFSSAVVGGFVAALGFGGALADSLGASSYVALAVGLAAGVGFGWFAWWLTRLVRDGGSDDTVTVDDTVGRDGKVIAEVPADGYGRVRVLVGGHTLELNARAPDPLPAGTAVHVTEVLSPSAVLVAPLWSP